MREKKQNRRQRGDGTMGIERKRFGAGKYITVELESKHLEKPKEAHRYLKSKMHLPAYYGNNLNALYHCLSTMQDTTITLLHEKKSGEYYSKVRQVFQRAGAQNDRLWVCEQACMPNHKFDE